MRCGSKFELNFIVFGENGHCLISAATVDTVVSLGLVLGAAVGGQELDVH